MKEIIVKIVVIVGWTHWIKARQEFARPGTRRGSGSPRQARYNGISVTERTLIPEGNARLGKIRFEDWLARPATQTPLRLAAKDRLTHTTHENKIDRTKG